jgi:hypothetical protein
MKVKIYSPFFLTSHSALHASRTRILLATYATIFTCGQLRLKNNPLNRITKGVIKFASRSIGLWGIFSDRSIM